MKTTARLTFSSTAALIVCAVYCGAATAELRATGSEREAGFQVAVMGDDWLIDAPLRAIGIDAGASFAISDVRTAFSVTGSGSAPRARSSDNDNLLPGNPILRAMPAAAVMPNPEHFISRVTGPARPAGRDQFLGDWPYAINGWQWAAVDEQGSAVAQSMVAMGNPVPAPGALALAVVGLAFVLRRRRDQA